MSDVDDNFRDGLIDGPKLLALTSAKLQKLAIEEPAHRAMIVECISELNRGDSKMVRMNTDDCCLMLCSSYRFEIPSR